MLEVLKRKHILQDLFVFLLDFVLEPFAKNERAKSWRFVLGKFNVPLSPETSPKEPLTTHRTKTILFTFLLVIG